MRKQLLLIAGIIPIILSCAISYHYDFSLLSVDRTKPAAEKYGPARIEKDTTGGAIRYRFSDSCVAVLFTISTEQVEFVCTNKTDRPIKLDWEKASFVNPYGAHKRVIHRGVAFSRKADRQQPSIIRKGETLSDYLLPSENVNDYLYGSGGHTIYPLFSNRDFGKNAGVLLPLEIDGVTNEYLFQFKISVVQ
jgi:hypothetical protein